MTYPSNNDPNRRAPNGANYTPWIIGGIAALALVFGVLFMTGDRTTNTAMNRGVTTSTPVTPAPASSPPASTTGSAR